MRWQLSKQLRPADRFIRTVHCRTPNAHETRTGVGFGTLHLNSGRLAPEGTLSQTSTAPVAGASALGRCPAERSAATVGLRISTTQQAREQTIPGDAKRRAVSATPCHQRLRVKQGAREQQTAHHRHYQYAPASLNNASLEQVQLTNETQQRDGACQNNQVPSTPP